MEPKRRRGRQHSSAGDNKRRQRNGLFARIRTESHRPVPTQRSFRQSIESDGDPVLLPRRRHNISVYRIRHALCAPLCHDQRQGAKSLRNVPHDIRRIQTTGEHSVATRPREPVSGNGRRRRHRSQRERQRQPLVHSTMLVHSVDLAVRYRLSGVPRAALSPRNEHGLHEGADRAIRDEYLHGNPGTTAGILRGQDQHPRFRHPFLVPTRQAPDCLRGFAIPDAL